MSETFDCQICCETAKTVVRGKRQEIICPKCQLVFCLNCQFSYGKGDCMKCQLVFTQTFLKNTMGSKFINDVVKPKLIEALLAEQELSLPAVQPLVEWEKAIRQQKKEARFGKIGAPIERPKLSLRKNDIFPCPKTSCRGFIEKGVCGICKQEVCWKCHEPSAKNHVCKIEDLQAVAAIMKETKPCPKCAANIYKTEGCAHMFCTNCHTHFSWTSGQIMNTSTNHHYLHLQRFTHGVATRNVNADSNCDDSDTLPFSLDHDRVELTEIDQSEIPVEIIRCVYDDSNAIRLAKKSLFNEPKILEEHLESLQELQIRYLLNEIDKKQWSQQIYKVTNKKNLAMLHANIFNIYLTCIDQLQLQLSKIVAGCAGSAGYAGCAGGTGGAGRTGRAGGVGSAGGTGRTGGVWSAGGTVRVGGTVRAGGAGGVGSAVGTVHAGSARGTGRDMDAGGDDVEGFSNIKKTISELITLCNQSFDSIHEEYGGRHPHIRLMSDDNDVAVLRL